MAGRSKHFAAPLLLAVITGLIVYVSLFPFRFVADGPGLAEALRSLSWARAGRGDMFNNVLLYAPFGFCVALLVEPRWGRVAGIVAGTLLGAALSLSLEVLQASVAVARAEPARPVAEHRGDRCSARCSAPSSTRSAAASRPRALHAAVPRSSRCRSWCCG